jgi:hypothetical protein
MSYNPKLPLMITVHLNCPLVVTFRLWYRTSGDTSWTDVGSDNSANGPEFKYKINGKPDEVQAGSTVRWFFHFMGKANSPYKASITLEQQGVDVVPEVKLSGLTNGKGTATEEGEVSLP